MGLEEFSGKYPDIRGMKRSTVAEMDESIENIGDINTGNPDKAKMDGFLVGLIAGEGSFSICIKKNDKKELGCDVTPQFMIQLHKSDAEILEYLCDSVSLGHMRQNGDYTSWTMNSIPECIEFANTLDNIIKGTCFKYTEKYDSFIVWKKCLKAIEDEKHKTEEGIIEIAELRDKMNRDSRGRTKEEVVNEFNLES